MVEYLTLAAHSSGCIACIYPTSPIVSIYAPNGQTARKNANVNYTARWSVMGPSLRSRGLQAGALERVVGRV